MVKWDIVKIFVRGKIIGQVTKLRTGKMFTSEKNKKCRDFQDLRWGKARRKKELSGVPFVVEVTRLHLFTLFFRHSLLTGKGSRKPAGKAGFSEASSSRSKRDIPERPWYFIVTEMHQRFDEYGICRKWSQVCVNTYPVLQQGHER